MSPASIPDPGEQEGLDSHVIPPTVAELPQEDDPEILPFKISFAKYNRKECEIDGIDPDYAKAALTTLRDVGVYFTSEDAYAKQSIHSEIKYVNNDGDYGRLFKGMGDAEIKEIKFQNQKKKVDGRLFFFTLEKERTFYLVAVRQNHYDTEKGDFREKVRKSPRPFWGR